MLRGRKNLTARVVRVKLDFTQCPPTRKSYPRQSPLETSEQVGCLQSFLELLVARRGIVSVFDRGHERHDGFGSGDLGGYLSFLYVVTALERTVA